MAWVGARGSTVPPTQLKSLKYITRQRTVERDSSHRAKDKNVAFKYRCTTNLQPDTFRGKSWFRLPELQHLTMRGWARAVQGAYRIASRVYGEPIE